jgi:MraZ protein
MSLVQDFFQGEFTRTLDERYRLSIPQELAEAIAKQGTECALVKERSGCLSLWPIAAWRQRLQLAVDLLKAKMTAGKLESKLPELQSLGRMLSTRHKEVQLAGRGRLLIPEGFREFLQVEAGGDAIVVGAAVCIEIWNPAAWRTHLEMQLPTFQQLFDQLVN